MIDFQNKSVWKLKQDKGIKHDQLKEILVEGEEFMSSYTAGRDYVAFTNKRIVAVNVQGMTGKKQDFTSIPYSKINCFSVETAGVFDLDAELDKEPYGTFWEIDFETREKEYSYDIDAMTGEIVYQEREIND